VPQRIFGRGVTIGMVTSYRINGLVVQTGDIICTSNGKPDIFLTRKERTRFTAASWPTKPTSRLESTSTPGWRWSSCPEPMRLSIHKKFGKEIHTASHKENENER